MNGGEFLQTSHLPEAKHGPFSSSKWQMGILSPIVQPAANLLPVVVPNNSHRGAIRPQFVRHDDLWLALSLHSFSEEFQYCISISTLCDVAVEHLALMIDRPLEIMPRTVDLHENLAHMPLPVRIRSHPTNPVSADLCRKHRTKSVPPDPHGFVANIDPALVEKILDIAERKWKANVHHDRRADDRGAAVKALERV